MIILAILVGFVIATLGAMIITPRVVEYGETIEIEKPVAQVYDAIRRQEDLMRWSAWPSETGSRCSVQGPDGEVGAQTVFLDKKGKKSGYQEITRLEPHVLAGFKLESKGPRTFPPWTYTLSL